MTAEVFNEDYFMRGEKAGVSNYEDYRWLGEPTIAACKRIAEYVGAKAGDSILDVGAARGFYVRGYRILGFRAFGYDVSRWAVANCDPSVTQWMSTELPQRAFDWIQLKDIAEHVPEEMLAILIGQLRIMTSRGIFLIVPLAGKTNGAYCRAQDEKDSTHVIRWTLDDWIAFLEKNAVGFNVNASYHIEGIKPASSEVYHSCGFFTLFRP